MTVKPSQMRPSDTNRGRAWLDNFETEDVFAARLLLDSMRIASLSEVRAGLQLRLKALIAQEQIQVPVMLVSALSVEDLRIDLRKGPLPIAFESIQLDDLISSTPGSEGFIGNLIRDIVRSNGARKSDLLPPKTPLGELRRVKCRSIVVVTDYAGSGTQLRNYAMTLVRHSTLRSWRSYGLLRIHALAYAASSISEKILLRKGSPFDGVWSVETAPSFADARWSEKERNAILELCVNYARKKDRNRALGYKGSAGLYATDASVPNNLPPILRQHHSGWNPFFEGRIFPPELSSELGGYRPRIGPKEIAERIGQPRLSRNIDYKYIRNATDEIFLILALLVERSRSSNELARELSTQISVIDEYLQALRNLGLVDEANKVTSLGRRELSTGKRAPRRVEARIAGSDAPYYPGALR